MLALGEWVVLGLSNEKPTHSYAIVNLLAKDGALGQIWHLPKMSIYRATDRLEQLGLITMADREPSNLGPARARLETTSKGDQLVRDWLREPVAHTRDIRSELLIKLALLSRIDCDPRGLLQAQRAQLTLIADALAAEMDTAIRIDRTVALWRYRSISAALRFLDDLLASSLPLMSA